MRFGPCLEYSLSVQPELLSYRLPKNLLQPIVENSLNHGMRRSKSIFVRLNAVAFPDHVAVSISDNGRHGFRHPFAPAKIPLLRI